MGMAVPVKEVAVAASAQVGASNAVIKSRANIRAKVKVKAKVEIKPTVPVEECARFLDTTIYAASVELILQVGNSVSRLARARCAIQTAQVGTRMCVKSGVSSTTHRLAEL